MSAINYTLYYGAYSLCSMMVRLTIRFRGDHKDSLTTHFDEQHINIIAKENITESYLLNVNRKGQVPALVSKSLPEGKPIADSLYITEYLASEYPSLCPTEHKTAIVEGLHKLHGLNYYSLSYAGTNQFTHWLQGELQKILSGSDISPEYRKAIEYKLGVIEQEYVGGLKTETVEDMVERARVLLLEFSASLPQGSQWLFGLQSPSALDAHLIPFLVRLKDVGRQELVPSNLMEYVERCEGMEEWKDMMQGRSTYSPADNVKNAK